MYLVVSLVVLRAGCGIWLYQFPIIAYLFTFQIDVFETCSKWLKWQEVSVGIKILSLGGCPPLSCGYIHLLNHEKMSMKSEVEQMTKVMRPQDQDSLLVKCRNDNHSPGPVIRELVPSSHQRSELSKTILCIFSGWDQRIGEGIPIPDSLGEETTFINICIGNGSLKCHRVLISTTPSFGDKVICWYTGFTFKTFI